MGAFVITLANGGEYVTSGDVTFEGGRAFWRNVEGRALSCYITELKSITRRQ